MSLITKPLDGKALAPNRGNAKVVYNLVANLNGWVSAEMIIGLINPDDLFPARSNRPSASPHVRIKNAILYLCDSGRFDCKGKKYRVASFADFEVRQRFLGEINSSHALKEYYDGGTSRQPVSVNDREEVSPIPYKPSLEKKPAADGALHHSSFICGVGVGAMIGGAISFMFMLVITGAA